ncbi:unnamed protein product, partial [Ectocarpus sp. 12 AP-2014]
MNTHGMNTHGMNTHGMNTHGMKTTARLSCGLQAHPNGISGGRIFLCGVIWSIGPVLVCCHCLSTAQHHQLRSFMCAERVKICRNFSLHFLPLYLLVCKLGVYLLFQFLSPTSKPGGDARVR